MLYIQYYIKTVRFWLKYNGLGIVQRTTKLIEGGHRGLQDYRHMCYYFCVFYVFYVFFQNPKSRDFLRFFAVFHTFSRTMSGVSPPKTPRTDHHLAMPFGQGKIIKIVVRGHILRLNAPNSIFGWASAPCRSHWGDYSVPQTS